jgi:hypothetical protein
LEAEIQAGGDIVWLFIGLGPKLPIGLTSGLSLSVKDALINLLESESPASGVSPSF